MERECADCNHALMPHACGAEPRAHVFVFAGGAPAGLAELDESLDVQERYEPAVLTRN